MSRIIITLGFFDGVHKGHQFLLCELVNKANLLHAEPVVITYNQCSKPTKFASLLQEKNCFLNNDHCDYTVLSEPKQRIEKIKKIGINTIDLLDFTDIQNMAAEEFLKSVLVQKYHPLAILIGYDTRFGFNRSGDVQFLYNHSEKYNYEVYQIPPYQMEQHLISSTLIRNTLKSGEVHLAHKYLGYYYSLSGVVQHGKKMGTKIGFPTMNLKVNFPQKLVPHAGIYFTCTRIKDKFYFSGTNIGYAPTLNTENKIRIETHLLDFSQDMYNQEIEIFFLERMRAEIRFPAWENLAQQIKEDMEQIKVKSLQYGLLAPELFL